MLRLVKELETLGVSKKGVVLLLSLKERKQESDEEALQASQGKNKCQPRKE